MNTIQISKERRSLIVLMVALGALFLYLMRQFLLPIILAAIIVILFYPVYTRLVGFFEGLKLGPRLQRLIAPRHVAALIATLVVLVILILPTAWVTAQLIDQLRELVGLVDIPENITALFTSENYNLYVQPYITQIEERFGFKVELFKWLAEAARFITDAAAKYFPQIFLGTAGFVLDFFIMLFGIYFLFVDGPVLLRTLFDISPLSVTHERKLSRQFRDVIDATVYGYLVTSLVQAVIAAIVFKFSGLSSWVVLGTLTFFMSMVPVVGAAGVWVPVTIWFFLTGDYATGAGNIAGGVVISAIDNFLKPIIIQGKTKIHPLLIFFSLFGGITIFGPVGILFGPVITSLLIATVKIYRDEYL